MIKPWTSGGSRVAWNDVKAWAAAAILCLVAFGYPAGSSHAAQERLIEAPSLFSSSDDVERVRSSVAFDTLWAFGGPSDTLLASPMLPRLDGAQGLVFFDMLNQAAYRLGKDGELLWSWGTKGEGPGELQAVEAIDVAPDGSVVLLDSDNLRVVRLSADGRLLEETRAPEGAVYMSSVAALRGGRLVVADGVVGPLLALWDGNDVVAAGLPADLGEPHRMLHQGGLVRWRDNAWVFGFSSGNGWATFREDQLMGVYPYVKHSLFGRAREVRQGAAVRTWMMARPVETGRSLSVVGDTLFVLFGAEDWTQGRILDKFDLRSGAYLETEFLPHFANWAVVGEDRVFTIEAWDVYPRIVALARYSSRSPITNGER